MKEFENQEGEGAAQGKNLKSPFFQFSCGIQVAVTL